jgi:hypothetical protein
MKVKRESYHLVRDGVTPKGEIISNNHEVT